MYRMYIDNLICIYIAVRSMSGSEKGEFPGICLFFMKKMLFFIELLLTFCFEMSIIYTNEITR